MLVRVFSLVSLLVFAIPTYASVPAQPPRRPFKESTIAAPLATLRALPQLEFKRLISGRSVTSPVDTTHAPNHQLIEYFYKGDRYASYRHGDEDVGTYFFTGNSLCVRTSNRIRCRIAIIDSERRLWLVRSFDPASFSEARIGSIPR